MPPARHRQRSTLATYAPLLLTLTAASLGVAAWIYSEHRSRTDDDDEQPGPPPSYRDPSTLPGPSPSQSTGVASPPGLVERVTGPVSAGLRSGAGAVAGAVAAAGAAMGLGGGGEERRGDGGAARKRERERRAAREREEGFSDHERWTEQAVLLKEGEREKGKARRRNVVAVVVSAEDEAGGEDGGEHASILSHIPHPPDAARTDFFVLVYRPHVQEQPAPAPSKLETQAALLVPQPAQVLPFSTPTGYVHMLRHLGPNLVYVQDTPALSGDGGKVLGGLKGWVGQAVLIVGGGDGAGGLVDTETEDEGAGKKQSPVSAWYLSSDMVGLGKGLEVVDVSRLEEDWTRRVDA